MSLADLQLAHCRSCGARMYVLKNDSTGKPAPIDVDRYTKHFQTSPNDARHQKA